jgi:hypothetical protein
MGFSRFHARPFFRPIPTRLNEALAIQLTELITPKALATKLRLEAFDRPIRLPEINPALNVQRPHSCASRRRRNDSLTYFPLRRT